MAVEEDGSAYLIEVLRFLLNSLISRILSFVRGWRKHLEACNNLQKYIMKLTKEVSYSLLLAPILILLWRTSLILSSTSRSSKAESCGIASVHRYFREKAIRQVEYNRNWLHRGYPQSPQTRQTTTCLVVANRRFIQNTEQIHRFFGGNSHFLAPKFSSNSYYF